MTLEEYEKLIRQVGLSDSEINEELERFYGNQVEKTELHTPEDVDSNEIVIPELSDDKFTGNAKKVVPNLKPSKRQKIKDFLKEKVLPYALGGAIAVMLGAGASQLAFRSFVNDLPKVAVTDSAIEELQINDEITWTLNKKTRFMFPRNGKVTINMNIDLNNKEKVVIDEAVEEVNTILHLVNDDYELRTEYNKNKFKTLYSITVSDEDLNDNLLGYYRNGFSFYTLNGEGVYTGIVSLDMDKIRSDEKIATTELKNVFLHEVFGHGIARMGDAYEVVDEKGNKIYSKLTLLDSSDPYKMANSSSPMIYDVDIKNFLAKYGNDITEERANELIDEYKENSKMYSDYRAELQSIKENIQDVYKTTFGETIDVDKIQFTGLDGICYHSFVARDAKSFFGYYDKVIYEYVEKLPVAEECTMFKSVRMGVDVDFGTSTQKESMLVSSNTYKKVDGVISLNYNKSSYSNHLFRYEDMLYGVFNNNGELGLSKIGTVISEDEYNEFVNNERFNKFSFGRTELIDRCYNQFLPELVMNGKYIMPIDYDKLITNANDEGKNILIRGENIDAIFSPDEVIIKKYELNDEGEKKLVSKNNHSYSFYNNMIYTSSGICLAPVEDGWYIVNMTYDMNRGVIVDKQYTGEALAYYTKIQTTTSTDTKSATENKVETEEKKGAEVAENKTKEETVDYISDKKGRIKSEYTYLVDSQKAILEKNHIDNERIK